MRKIILAASGVALYGAVALAQPAATPTPRAPAPPAAPCTPGPVGELSFICGVSHPEDLAQIPGTKWLIASGFTAGAGLKLVDTDAKTMRFWYAGSPDQIRPDTKTYKDCPGAPDVKAFNAHGINLRSRPDGLLTLYVVNHGGRQSI